MAVAASSNVDIVCVEIFKVIFGGLVDVPLSVHDRRPKFCR
jgi:hypothetical protein